MDSRRVAAGAPDWTAYARLLQADGAEAARLKDRLSVAVTGFLRDPEVWDALMQGALLDSAREAAARPGREWRWWSAGCSTGQEAYTLAMAALETARGAGVDARLRVLASDFDRAAVERAEEGAYSAAECAALPEIWLERYFLRDATGLRAGRELRSRVDFRRRDLLSAPPPQDLDGIVCRNVMIYFSRDAQQRVWWGFHQALRPGGILVTGKTETVLGPARAGFKGRVPAARLFERV